MYHSLHNLKCKSIKSIFLTVLAFSFLWHKIVTPNQKALKKPAPSHQQSHNLLKSDLLSEPPAAAVTIDQVTFKK